MATNWPCGTEKLTELTASHGEDRQAVVCRELTKIHEEIVRGTLPELAAWAGSGPVRGEITLVVAGTGRRSVRGIRAGADPGPGPGGGPGPWPGADRPPHRVR